jgi:hypothetical protein
MPTQPFPIVLGRPTLPVGLGPPNRYYVALQNSAALPDYVPPVDFTTVTGVTLRVRRERDGSTASWSTSAFTDVTVDGLVAGYALQPGDLSVEGPYIIQAYLSVPGFPDAVVCGEGHVLTVTP